MASKPTSINLLGPKILIVLYSIVGLIPRFEAVDPIGSQWFYFAVVNVLALTFLWLNKDIRVSLVKGQASLWFFGAYLLFFIFSLLSIFGGLNLSEGVKDICRIAITMIATFNLFLLFRIDPRSMFAFLVKTIHIVILLIGIQIVYYFVDNFDILRSTKLMKGAELLFGNRNVTAAALVIQLPFAIYGFLTHQKRWKIVSVITFFIGYTALFYVGARAALLSMVVMFGFLFVYIVADAIRTKSLSRKLKYPMLPLIAVIILGFLLVTNTNRVEKSKANSYTTILSTPDVDASGNIVKRKVAPKRSAGMDNGRFIYFEMALDDIKANPILGVGLGSWKLTNKDKYFAQAKADRFLYPLRVHSDFLQVLAEVGFLGFLPFLALFVVLAWLGFRLFFKYFGTQDGFLYFTLLMGLMAYAVDALLNFPMERTPIQALFAVLAAMLLALATLERKEVEADTLAKYRKVILGTVGAVALVASVFTFMKYKSYVSQNYILADILGKNLMVDKYSYSYTQAREKLDGFFNIAGVGRPNEHVKGMYAMSEGKLDKALSHLDKAMEQAPNHYESSMLKAIIYGQRKVNHDSAIFYAKKGFEKYPVIKNNYVLLLNAYRAKGDTVNYFKTYDERLAKFPDDVSQWKAKSQRIMEFYKDPTRAAAIVDEAIKANPEDSTLVTFKDRYTGRVRETDIRAWYKNGFELINEKKYPEAKKEFLRILEVTPSNNPTLLNLGIIEIKMKQYKEAVEHLSLVIDSRAFKDGRPEYNRGLAHERLGNTQAAKKDYRRSKELGFGLAMKLPENKLN